MSVVDCRQDHRNLKLFADESLMSLIERSIPKSTYCFANALKRTINIALSIPYHNTMSNIDTKSPKVPSGSIEML